MLNTENITLESWPGLEAPKNRHKPVYHFALRQRGLNIDFHIEHFFRGKEISFHYFDDFPTLMTICQRFPVSSIIMGGHSDFFRELDLLHSIKQNAFLSIIPVIMYHPDPEQMVVLAAYENQCDDFINGEWHDRIVEARIRRVIERSRRDLAINPSTYLPGPGLIEEVIQQQLDMKEEFAVCYADLDNFKAYNDYYGYTAGDSVIRLTGRIIRDVVFDLCREGFVGHIAGDDFIYVIPVDIIDETCRWILRTFDGLIPYRYEEADRDRGSIKTPNRRGEVEDYPILTMSIAVIINRQGKFQHIGELSKMLADLKKAAKAKAGSNYLIERREKY
ncbi:diguanylate cyclase [bacterium]|nr:diguanylate cyclase [bacterium]MCB2201722.1 diguanylate cyclase [bacterium]